MAEESFGFVFHAVHFADDDGVPLAESVGSSLEDFAFCAPDIATDEIGGGMSFAVVVEGNAGHL
jgi:hypothetical protein